MSVWSRASLRQIGLAGRLDAGVSRSASLLAASLSDGGDIVAKPTTAHPVPHFFQAGSCSTKNFPASKFSLAVAPGKPLELWFVARASVSVLTAMLDYPVPSGWFPLGHVPKVRPYRRAGYETGEGPVWKFGL